MHALRSSGLLPPKVLSISLAGGAAGAGVLSLSSGISSRQQESEEEEQLSDLEDLPQQEYAVKEEHETIGIGLPHQQQRVSMHTVQEDGNHTCTRATAVDKLNSTYQPQQSSLTENEVVGKPKVMEREPPVKGDEDVVETSNVQNNHLVELSIQFLNVFTPHTEGPSDPVLALTLFYQKKQIISTKEYFQEHSVGGGAFWFSFACPLNGVEYTSCLPLPFFQPEPIDDRLVALASNIFGNYRITRNQVVFKTKKGAKRAVAYAALEAHKQMGMMTSKLMVSSTENSSAQRDDSPVETSKKSLQNLPKWVHELHQMGIDSNSLEISYRQQFLGKEPLTPCQLCCIISIRQPSSLTAISLPCPSKRLAVDNAVMLLTEALKRTASSDPSIPSGQSQLANIYRCNPTKTSYMKSLPLWANNPVQRKAILYRVRFLTTVGTDLVSSRSGLGLDMLTPLGIVFFSDLPSPITNKEYFQAEFELQAPRRDKQERVTIQLSNPTQIDLSNSSQRFSVSQRKDVMELFNEKAYLWKDYGQQSSSIDRAKTGKQSKKPISLLNRTYMFAPLKKEETSPAIDWDLLQRIAANERSPYLTGIDQDWFLPLFGEVDLLFFSAVLGSMSISILIPDLIIAVRNLNGGNLSHNLRVLYCSPYNTIGTCLAVLSIVALTMFLVWPPKKNFKPNHLQNRFMVEQKPGPRPLYVTPSKDNFNDPLAFIESHQLSGKSKVCASTDPGPSEGALESNLRKHNLDLRTASFVELYRKKFGIKVRYPQCSLLHGIPLKSHSEQDFFFVAKEERSMKLIPELVLVLPMPRDVLYLLRHANVFMPAIEQAIEFEALAAYFSLSLTAPAPTLPIKWPMTGGRTRPELVSRLSEALDVDTYQRLEFLGDIVLGFFLAVNLMARNSSLTWDTDDLSQVFTDAVKNTTLYDAALRTGIGTLLCGGNETWQNSLQTNNRAKSLSEPLEMIQTISHSRESNYQVVTVPDKVMSDVVESLLGAAFVAGKSVDSWCMKLVIGLLEKLQIPISDQQSDCVERNSSDLPWFRATSSCVSQGYDFTEDKAWQDQMIEIGVSLNFDHDVGEKLEHGYQQLVSLLIGLSGDETLTEKLSGQQSKRLLLCALFDDSLKDMQDDMFNAVDLKPAIAALSTGVEGRRTTGTRQENGLFRAALLRDTLVMVGSHAFQLCITTDLFHRYPSANEGDLHMLRVCATSHDVCVYIMFKAGIHQFLLDQGAVSIRRFESIMVLADELGKAKWRKRDGWILPGGTSEFAARCSARRTNHDMHINSTTATTTPQYCGLAGGRLRGQKQKLPDSITSDLTFSMNAIIGALVLSIGLEGMWSCIGPLFEEIMLLTPSELRQEYGSLSSIVV